MKPLVPVPDQTSRRAFCTHSCLAAAAVALAALANDACGGGGSATSPGGSGSTGSALTTATATVAGRTISVVVDGSPLATVGSAAIVRTSAGTYLVARTGQEAFSALSSSCTHEGQSVSNWTGSQFGCPAHGALFTTSGSVARGPATRPLTSYPAVFANGVVTFSV